MKNLILIVDDTEMNRSPARGHARPGLRDPGSGQRRGGGLPSVAAAWEISLVLLDIVMPEMDGFEVLSLMNRNGWIEHIPVITISSETASTYIDHAYDLGASDYISRPFDEKTVQRRVRNTIMLYSKQKVLESMVAEQIVEKERNNFLMVGDPLQHRRIPQRGKRAACAAHPHPDRNPAAQFAGDQRALSPFRRAHGADRQRLGPA